MHRPKVRLGGGGVKKQERRSFSLPRTSCDLGPAARPLSSLAGEAAVLRNACRKTALPLLLVRAPSNPAETPQTTGSQGSHTVLLRPPAPRPPGSGCIRAAPCEWDTTTSLASAPAALVGGWRPFSSWKLEGNGASFFCHFTPLLLSSDQLPMIRHPGTKHRPPLAGLLEPSLALWQASCPRFCHFLPMGTGWRGLGATGLAPAEH